MVKLPIKQIGEENWIDKLTEFLVERDVEVIPLGDYSQVFGHTEKTLNWTIPQQIKDYFSAFGGIKSGDFMYGLYEINKWQVLTNSDWSFISEYFPKNETDNYIVFADSPATDPICFDKLSGEVYLFSHYPVRKAKVYKSFNDFLLDEIIHLQVLFLEVDFASKEAEIEYKANLLSGEGIDFVFRYMRLSGVMPSF